jgi:hypothetical protein
MRWIFQRILDPTAISRFFKGYWILRRSAGFSKDKTGKNDLGPTISFKINLEGRVKRDKYLAPRSLQDAELARVNDPILEINR